ncbi:MAG: primosomal protein N' [Anaerolineae bacterium]|nr:primosomal protein N' [Anaerolineae bacterium]
MYAQVLIFLPIKSKESPFFDYVIPDALADTLQPGSLVSVPFRRHQLPGIVMSLSAHPAAPNPRPVLKVLDPEPVLRPALLDLARWMARETLAPLHTCVKVMLPPGLRPRRILLLKPQVASPPPELPETAHALLELLIRRGPLNNTQVAAAMKGKKWRPAMRYLRQAGYIATERTQQLPQPQPRMVRMAMLNAPREQWETLMEGLRLEVYETILAFLEKEGEPVAVAVVCAETGARTSHLTTLQKRNLIAFSHETLIRDPLAEMIFTPATPPPLLVDQQRAWDYISGQLTTLEEKHRPVLLLGVTGSGKTEIYLRATADVLQRGAQALILEPEISLTPQTVRRFALRFPGIVGVWHSGMTDGERYDTWRRIRSGDLKVLVGARSALFAPFSRLGLIVMDEEEDSSYKQNVRPFYHTRETAEELARRTGALMIMGSATPSLEAYHRALIGRYHLLQMPRRIMAHSRRVADWQRYLQIPTSRYHTLQDATEACTINLPPVQIVDMRAELKAGNRSIFSRPLKQAVDRALSHDEQVILFLNRRGASTHVFCRDCGWAAQCPRCDIPLTYHERAEALICHHCDYQTGMIQRCPVCQSQRVRAFGLGTEGLERYAAEQWPLARRIRWDRDVARSHAAHTSLLAQFAAGESNLLIGTQMIARGLDLPGVTVVGIISADVGLHLPDFRAAERSFQLLAQVAGRSGRGLLGGRVILQTYHPDHYVIQHAAVHDYVGFSRRELAFRKAAGYPPFVRMARLEFQDPNAHRAKEEAEALAATLRAALVREALAPEDLIGPAPAFFSRIRGRYRWHILLRHMNPAAFLSKYDIPAGWRVDIDPVDVL